MIIAVIGRAGTGKTVASKVIHEYLGWPLVETSDVVRSITKGTVRQSMNLNKYELEREDPDWLWKAMKDNVINVSEGFQRNCIISGIREPYLLFKLLEENISGDVVTLGLDATLFTRYSRLCLRDGFISVEDFRKTDNGILEKDNFVGDNTLGIDITLSRCDKILNANGSLEQLRRDIERFLFEYKLLKPRMTPIK
jgi:dephospho-CoA kinase